MTAVLTITDITKQFDVRGARGVRLTAVDGVSLHVNEGETYALVGESGCGKSTLARCATMLNRPDSGSIEWSGHEVSSLGRGPLRAMRDHTQMVFQDPASALSPRFTVEDAVLEPLRILERSEDGMADTLLDFVGLDRSFRSRYPRELSGGQRQRVVIARALALSPRLLVLDEPVASLDVSVQAQVLNLLGELQRENGFGYLMIAHDLAVVSSIADRVGVMYLGQLVEEGAAADVVTNPKHPYTQMLIESVPAFEPNDRAERPERIGEQPSPTHVHRGCPFASRCPLRTQICDDVAPEPRDVGGSTVRCHHATAD